MPGFCFIKKKGDDQMEKLRTYVNSLSETISMTRKENVLMLMVAALLGCVIGMLVSPRKTVSCGNGNGTQNYYGASEADDSDEE